MRTLLICFIGSFLLGCKEDNSKTMIAEGKIARIYFDNDRSTLDAQRLTEIQDENFYISLHKYKGEYFLYSPSDWMERSSFHFFRDSVIINVGGEEYTFFITKRDSLNQAFVLKNQYLDNVPLEMKPLEPAKGFYIAKLQFHKENGPSYRLLVKSTHTANLPIIVYDSPTEKWGDVSIEMDSLDLKKWFEKH